ncbi:MAG: DMT family transporter [Alphaproteobacteria bacterium]
MGDAPHAVPLWAAVAVLIAGFLWSLQGITIRLLDEATGDQIIFWRNFAQCLTLLAAIAIRNNGRVLTAIRTAGKTALLGGTFQATSSVTVVFAFTLTTVASVNFILSTSPFIAGFLAWVFLRERLDLKTIGAMAAGAVGVGVMMSGDIGSGQLLGNALVFIGTVCFSALTVALRTKRHVDMLPTTFWGSSIGIIAGLAIAGGTVAMPLHDIALCLFMGSVQIGLGQVLFIMASRHVPAGLLAFLSLSEIVLGPIWAWLGVNEVPGAMTLLGGVIVMGALVFQAVAAQRNRR